MNAYYWRIDRNPTATIEALFDVIEGKVFIKGELTEDRYGIETFEYKSNSLIKTINTVRITKHGYYPSTGRINFPYIYTISHYDRKKGWTVPYHNVLFILDNYSTGVDFRNGYVSQIDVNVKVFALDNNGKIKSYNKINEREKVTFEKYIEINNTTYGIQIKCRIQEYSNEKMKFNTHWYNIINQLMFQHFCNSYMDEFRMRQILDEGFHIKLQNGFRLTLYQNGLFLLFKTPINNVIYIYPVLDNVYFVSHLIEYINSIVDVIEYGDIYIIKDAECYILIPTSKLIEKIKNRIENVLSIQICDDIYKEFHLFAYHFQHDKLNTKEDIEYGIKCIKKRIIDYCRYDNTKTIFDISSKFDDVKIRFDDAVNFGYCKYGIYDFCDKYNLPSDGIYSVKELKEHFSNFDKFKNSNDDKMLAKLIMFVVFEKEKIKGE